MRQKTYVPLALLTIALGLVIPRPSGAQALDGASTPGIDASHTFRLPVSLFGADRTTSTDEAASGGTLALPLHALLDQDKTQGAVPAPRMASGSLTTPKFASIPKVILYGLELTFYEHVMRISSQEFTREQLKGKFWQEWVDSIHMPKHWGDKDHWQVNYIGHAISGGAYARVWVETREPKPTNVSSYLKSRAKSLLYTTLMSIQYQIGPMSEASIGNVGLNPADIGWGDFVWTPIGGVLWTMFEDAADKYVLTYVDRYAPFFFAKSMARMILTPSRMLANIGMNRTPWSRHDRTMMGQPKTVR